MNLEIATKQEVVEWFASHHNERKMLVDLDYEVIGKYDDERSFEQIIETSDFLKHPVVGLIPSYLEDYGYENTVWSEVVFAEVYYLYIDKVLWYYQKRRSSEEPLELYGFSFVDRENYFPLNELDSAVESAKQEVREFRQLMENGSVNWGNRTWSKGKRFVYIGENNHFVEAADLEALQEIAAVKLSDIYESTAQIVQSAEGKLYVKATLLDEYLMEIETVEEAKIILEEFMHLWS
jgi:hypothetical protein